MEWVNPLLLWGMLAVSIPVLLHFWHQKKGQLLYWAATQWLAEKDLQSSKGIRLENLLLLIIRCLLLVLLSVYLAKPIWQKFQSTPTFPKIHLVQTNPLVVQNFKFELEKALREGEKVCWILPNCQPIKELDDSMRITDCTPFLIQSCIHQVQKQYAEEGNLAYHLYLTNNASLQAIPHINVPSAVAIHTISDSSQVAKPFVALADNKIGFQNQQGLFSVARANGIPDKLEATPTHQGAFGVYLSIQNKQHKEAILAAFKALAQVYQLEFNFQESVQSNTPIAIGIADSEAPLQKIPTELAILIGKQPTDPTNEALVVLPEEQIVSGQLPEWIGTQLLMKQQLAWQKVLLSQQGIRSVFKEETSKQAQEHGQEAGVSKIILAVFLGLLLCERWLALTKNT
ncbi:MAG: BatA domain-containing protein [Spirosomataceae bacterium]